jgi:hypothetical protein
MVIARVALNTIEKPRTGVFVVETTEEVGAMTKSGGTVAFALVAIGLTAPMDWFGAAGPAVAAPPTVQYSPGYDMRLAEARRAAQLASQQPLIVEPRARRRHHHHHRD